MAAELKLDQVRALHLRAQGLGLDRGEAGGLDDAARVLNAIDGMAALQIDTISVVARSPYLVLWSRVGDYDATALDRLLAKGAVFEGWAHAACFLPVEDFAAHRAIARERPLGRQRRQAEWLDANRELADRILARIRDEGPLRAADFERSDGRTSGPWWDWRDEKIALEALLSVGALMVRERRAFQRVYDLADRVCPTTELLPLSTADATRHLIMRAVGALGVATAPWIANYLFLGQPTRPIAAMAREMAREGLLDEIHVADWSTPAYALPGWVSANAEDATATPGSDTTLLSPFDPVVWDRDRLATLFSFDYRIECYTPAAKRTFGYFCLPILHAGEMVGRIDAKAHRREGIMEVTSLHLEPGVRPDADLVEGLADALDRFAAWHRTPEIVVRESNPATFRDELTQRLP